MKTPELIARLAESAAPVRPLRSPIVRALLWWLSTFALVALILVVLRGVSIHPRFGFGLLLFEGLALAFALLASTAVLAASVPGQDARRYALVAGLLLSGWVGLEAVRLLIELANSALLSPAAIVTGAPCARDIVLAAFPAVLALLLMLRMGLSARPVLAGAAVGLSAGVAGACVLRLFCPNDEAVHGILVHVAPAVAVGAAGALLGLWMLRKDRAALGLFD